MSVVPMNIDGFLMNLEKILPDSFPCFPCSSICNLLAERKAISIPEKEKEKIKERIISVMRPGSILFSLSVREDKKHNNWQHYGPIGISKTKGHYLVNANN